MPKLIYSRDTRSGTHYEQVAKFLAACYPKKRFRVILQRDDYYGDRQVGVEECWGGLPGVLFGGGFGQPLDLKAMGLETAHGLAQAMRAPAQTATGDEE